MASTTAEYKARRRKMLDYLGGKCVVCEAEDDLHIDHVDASSKRFDVSKNWSRSWEVLKKELDKCQVLCATHHKEKTQRNSESGGGHNKWTKIVHGTVWAYNKYKCRCDACKKVKAESRAKEYESVKQRGVGKFGNPSALGAEDRRFKSCHPDNGARQRVSHH